MGLQRADGRPHRENWQVQLNSRLILDRGTHDDIPQGPARIAGLFFRERLGEHVWGQTAEFMALAGVYIHKYNESRTEKHGIDLVEIVVVAREYLAERAAVIG